MFGFKIHGLRCWGGLKEAPKGGIFGASPVTRPLGTLEGL